MSDSTTRKRTAVEMSAKKNIVICMADGSEPLDILQSVDILRSFPRADIFMASPVQKQPQMVHLKDTLSISSDISFAQALSKSWHMIVLPGGNLGVSNMLEDSSLLALLSANHIPIAAMGASATRLLPAVGKVDPLGASCFTPKDCTVVLREQEFVWTAPGLGTTPDLIFCVCEHVFDSTETHQVAQAMRHNFKPAIHCHVESLYRPPSHREPPLLSSSSSSSGQDELLLRKTLKVQDAGFWKMVWPALAYLGWSLDSSSRWYYVSPEKHRFAKLDDVITYLEEQTDKVSIELCKRYRDNLQARREDDDGPIPMDPLFEYIVWSRLKPLGWNHKRHRKNHVFIAPENEFGKRLSMVEKKVIPFLLRDKEWGMKVESLAIVDLYQQCKRTQEIMGFKTMDPIVVEIETKNRFPAFAFY